MKLQHIASTYRYMYIYIYILAQIYIYIYIFVEHRAFQFSLENRLAVTQALG